MIFLKQALDKKGPNIGDHIYSPRFQTTLGRCQESAGGAGLKLHPSKPMVAKLTYGSRDKRKVLISHGFMWNWMVVPSPTGPTPTSSNNVVSVARNGRGS